MENERSDNYWVGFATGFVVCFFLCLALGIADYRGLF